MELKYWRNSNFSTKMEENERKPVERFYLFSLFVFAFSPRGMWDFSSLTGDRTWAHGSGSAESHPLDLQGSPWEISEVVEISAMSWVSLVLLSQGCAPHTVQAMQPWAHVKGQEERGAAHSCPPTVSLGDRYSCQHRLFCSHRARGSPQVPTAASLGVAPASSAPSASPTVDHPVIKIFSDTLG